MISSVAKIFETLPYDVQLLAVIKNSKSVTVVTAVNALKFHDSTFGKLLYLFSAI